MKTIETENEVKKNYFIFFNFEIKNRFVVSQFQLIVNLFYVVMKMVH